MKKPLIVFLAIVILGGAGIALYMQSAIPGFWALDSGASSLTVTSVKNGDFEEVHTFKDIRGEADFSGSFEIRIDLESIETGIPIRDERMAHYLFETETYPVAVISGAFAPGPFEDLAVEGSMITRISATLSLHGMEKDMSADVMVTRPERDRVVITSLNPVILEAADFGLEAGIEELRAIVELDSISGTVPVSFEFVFNGGARP